MKLNIKTLTQSQFNIEANPIETILNIKEKINSSHSHPVERQKLIFSGKVLADESTVESVLNGSNSDMGPTEFFVLMITKPKAAVPPKETSLSETTAATKIDSSIKSASTKTTTTTATTPSVKNFTETDSMLVVGTEYEAAVANLKEMGFAHDEIIKALRASYNNPARAVEYLTSGYIPEAEEEGTTNATAASLQQRQPEQQGNGSAFLSTLKNDPQFTQLKLLIRENPELLQPLLEQLAATNPQLIQLISENQDEFMRLLSEDILIEADEEDDEEVMMGEEGHAENENAASISVSSEDMQAIDRLAALGFDRSKAAEAFLACEKDETLAANFLFDNMNEE